ncbi:MAG: type II toxin-antitoxin system HicB family antitoxin [Desulfotomaculum sp.]|nr:type II toxin-antitoxin system HicB family antitoxin [Desulfotomaculum sp.]MCL0081509.1 type II toxin-antitoxin system HicB family antitoxin [Peptococcaceae bacterium]
MKPKDKYIYPAIFSYDDDGISVSFPGLPGCFTCGSNDEEAMYMAKDALGGYMCILEESGDEIIVPMPLNKVKTAENERAVLIDVWMPVIREAVENKAIKKTLTIPQWLNKMAMEQDINFSFILQEALKKKLNIDDYNIK